jgi:transcriptional regulator with XRE-family HTH domain
MEKNKGFNANAFGQVVKSARRFRGMTRNAVAEELSITPRYLMSIENSGQMPSLQVFYDLVTLFDISADRLFYYDEPLGRTPRRKALDTLLEQLPEEDIAIVEGTVQGIFKARKAFDANNHAKIRKDG